MKVIEQERHRSYSEKQKSTLLIPGTINIEVNMFGRVTDEFLRKYVENNGKQRSVADFF